MRITTYDSDAFVARKPSHLLCSWLTETTASALVSGDIPKEAAFIRHKCVTGTGYFGHELLYFRPRNA